MTRISISPIISLPLRRKDFKTLKEAQDEFDNLISFINASILPAIKRNFIAADTGSSGVTLDGWRIEVDGRNLSVFDPNGQYQGGWSY